MLEFTTEELLALAAGLEVGDPIFLAHTGVVTWPADVRREIDQVGARALVARDLVRKGDDGALTVPEALASMGKVAAAPDLIVRYFRVDHSSVGECSFMVASDLTVGHRTTSVGNHTMTMIPTEHAAAAIAEVCAVPDRPPAKGEGVRLMAEQVRAVFEAEASMSLSEDTESVLRRAGLDDRTIALMASLAQGGAISHVIQVAQFNVPDQTARADITTWVDGGSSGLWISERAEDEDATPAVDLHPATRREIVESILEGFPDWLDCGPAFLG